MNQASKLMNDVRDQWNRWGRIEHIMSPMPLQFAQNDQHTCKYTRCIDQWVVNQGTLRACW
ncbi:MAG: hypothetical protein ACKO9W_15725, partial [Bacteroidota bacterium]